MSIDLNLLRGTAQPGAAVLTRMSSLWLTYEEPLPAIGHIIRITDATYVPDTAAPAVFRADRIATVVWRMPACSPGGFATSRCPGRSQHQRSDGASWLRANGVPAPAQVSAVLLGGRPRRSLGGGGRRSDRRLYLELGLRRPVVSCTALRLSRPARERPWQ
jgi:hypothetical protein